MFNIDPSQIMQLALLGGLFSLLSTSVGALLILIGAKTASEGLSRFRLSIDFALGVMLSAVAFSLFGPELFRSFHRDNARLQAVLAGFSLGVIFIGWTHNFVEKKMASGKYRFNSTRVVLALALIFHNFPEGMGSGASLAGMSLQQALPIQLAIAVQNIPEGLILALCLLEFGWGKKMAILGSVASGGVEFAGAAVAGIALQSSMSLLPFLLSLAGGAMLMSVALELIESAKSGRLVMKKQLLGGFLLIPLLNFILGV